MTVEGFDLYRSRPINSRMRARFPDTLYYAMHFEEETQKLVFAFLGPDGCEERPDLLLGLEAQAQWNRFVDVMVRDPLISGLRIERIGSHATVEDCLAAAQADAGAPADAAKKTTRGVAPEDAEPMVADPI